MVVFLIALGALLAPTVVTACGKAHKKVEKSCAKDAKEDSKKETTSRTEKQDCCKGRHAASNKSKPDHGCGNCNHANCTCLHFPVTVALPAEPAVKHQTFHFSGQKQSVFDTEANLSSGFHSIWHPPKIS